MTPGGNASGDGSAAKPWDLQTALNGGGGKVKPGNTIWLRGGVYPAKTYACTALKGTAAAPIIVRAWPGERATVRNRIDPWSCAFTWLWGVELANTVANQQNLMGLNADATGTFDGAKFINLIVHDQSGNGLGIWTNALNAEAYGNLLYNNGFCGQDGGPPPAACHSFGHGIYSQNNTGAKLIQHNIALNSFGYGFHMYGESAFLKNFTLDGNVSVNSGQAETRANNFVMGGTALSGCRFTHNLAYASWNPAKQELNAGTWIGRNSAQNVDCLVRGNVMALGWPAFRFYRWSSLTFDSNRVVGIGQPGSLIDQQGPLKACTNNQVWGTPGANEATKEVAGMPYAAWAAANGCGVSNIFSTAPPVGTWVYVLPNKYEPGRATIVVYNWSGAPTAKADLTGVLPAGQAYEVRSAWNFFGSPVTTGTYQGGLVSIPTAGVEPQVPLVGPKRIGTGSAFGVYVIAPVGTLPK